MSRLPNRGTRTSSGALALRVVAFGAAGMGGLGCPSKEVPESAPSKPSIRDVASPPPPPASIATPAPATADPGPTASAVAWFDGSLDDALAQAERAGKRVLVDFGAYWCPPCQALDDEIWIRPEVGAFVAARYVPVRFEADRGVGERWARQYHVQALPTLIVLETNGEERGRLVEAPTPEALMEALSSIDRGEAPLGALEAAVAADPDDLAMRYRAGHAYALAARAEAAEGHFQVLELADPVDASGWMSQVMFDRAVYLRYKLANDAEGALGLLQALQSRFPDSPSADAAFIQIAKIHHREGREAEANAAIDAMLAMRPDDPAALRRVGWFSFREQWNPGQGRDAIATAIQGRPADAELHYLHAELSSRLGDDPSAVTSIRYAVLLDPLSPFYRRQLRRFQIEVAG